MKFKLIFRSHIGRQGPGLRTIVEGETVQDGLFFPLSTADAIGRATVEAALDMITKFTTLHASVTWEEK